MRKQISTLPDVMATAPAVYEDSNLGPQLLRHSWCSITVQSGTQIFRHTALLLLMLHAE